MKKFNTSDIFTGYLKQLLKAFNLPKLKVYTKEHEEYYKKYGKERSDILTTITATANEKGKKYFPNDTHYVPYIKDGKIQEYIKEYINEEWQEKWQALGGRNTKPTAPTYYAYGTKILNYTKNLIIKNNIYDSYTHEYLGDYLRFQRDYNSLNLMSLYNCFSNRSCDKLNIKEKITRYDPEKIESFETEIKFDSTDTQYKIYMIPVKLFQNYTIAIDSSTPIELCCGIYGDYQDSREKFKSLVTLTYTKINQSKFLQPFLFTSLGLNEVKNWDTSLKKELAKNEADLKLFIKIPVTNDSTIVVLEGNFIHWNDTQLNKRPAKILAIKKYFENVNTISDIEAGEIYLVKEDYRLDETDVNEKFKTNYNLYRGTSDNKLEFIKTLLNTTETSTRESFIKDTNRYTTNDIQEAYYLYKKNNNNAHARHVVYYNSYIGELYIPASEIYKTTNHTAINFDNLTNGLDIPLISPLQLLQFNTKEQHPFADRLIEYLLENAIVGTDEEIAANIKRAQKALKGGKQVGPVNGYSTNIPGVWDYKMNKLFYNYIVTKQNKSDINRDILGYVDKDVEKYYAYTDELTNETISLANIELNKGEK